MNVLTKEEFDSAIQYIDNENNKPTLNKKQIKDQRQQELSEESKKESKRRP